MKKHFAKKLGLSLVASAVLASGLSASDEQNLEATLVATTDSVYAVGGVYTINEHFKVAAGVLGINDLKSKDNVKDDFIGGYVSVEAKVMLDEQSMLFVDASYVGGETSDSNEYLHENIFGIGYKYNDEEFYSPYIGITSQETIYAGVSTNLTKNWEVGAGIMHDYSYRDETKLFATISYNFESGMASNVVTSFKSAIEDDMKDDMKAEPIQIFF